MLDLQLMSRLLDEAFERQTPESIAAFLASHPDDSPGFEWHPSDEAYTANDYVEGFTGKAINRPLAVTHSTFPLLKQAAQHAFEQADSLSESDYAKYNLAA